MAPMIEQWFLFRQGIYKCVGSYGLKDILIKSARAQRERRGDDMKSYSIWDFTSIKKIQGSVISGDEFSHIGQKNAWPCDTATAVKLKIPRLHVADAL